MSLVNQFLVQIRQQVRGHNGDLLKSWLQVEPESPKQYHDLAVALRSQCPDQHSIDAVVDNCLPQEDDVAEGQSTVWAGFLAFMKDYLIFWRDVNYSDLLGAHQLLSGLVNSCATAFSHPTHGGMLLQASMSLSETLARLTMTLNRRPDLTRRLQVQDEDNRKSVAEASAEIIQKIFTICLTDRTSDRYSKPEGKKIGVYMFSNIVLKLLFACRRTHLAKMIFVNISSKSPPLSLYPASQRVTFLYYLGRFNLSTHHYMRASLCLQEAYLQTPPSLVSHRAKILTYLIPCNMLLGRFPSQSLLQRPEAQSLRSIFLPICQTLRSGNFAQFQEHLATNENWLWEKGLLLTLTHRLRPMLWRALSRKTFLLTYTPPIDATSRKAATLDLSDLHAVAVYLQRSMEGWVPSQSSVLPKARPPHINALFMKAVTNNAQNLEATTLLPPPTGVKKLQSNEGMVWGNAEVTPEDVEMMIAALIQQGFLHGFVAHGQARFAIIGAKAKGSPLVAGWPSVWQAINDRRYEEDFDPDEVTGWVR